MMKDSGVTVGIVDYGVGNLGSIVNMFKHLDVEVSLVSTPSSVSSVTKLLLPGVGAFDRAMGELNRRDMVAPIKRFVANGGQLLGVCLGMQLLVESSEEGKLPGLGLIGGLCRRFTSPVAAPLRVPHMGWNTVRPTRESGLFNGLAEDSRFYFVHSYFVECSDNDVLARTEYGSAFASMIADGNVVGAQFHPEKSHSFGMTLLDNWARS